MEERAEIVSRNPLARPPLRPYEVFVTRRVPLVVYYKRCVKLLRGPHAKAVIRGAGSCVETAIFVAQDVIDAFGGQVIYSCCNSAATTAAAGGAAAGASDGASAAAVEGSAAAETPTGKAEAVFAAAASKLAAFCSSSAALLSISVETMSAQAYDEVISLGNKNDSEDEEVLEAAGIQQELSSFVRQRNVSAIKIELCRLPPPPC